MLRIRDNGMNTIDFDHTPPGLLEARRIAYDIAMRAKWNKKKRVSAAKSRRAQEALDWRARVDAALLESKDYSTSNDKLCELYTLLSFHLLTAPTEEDGNWLYDCVGDIKNRIVIRPRLHLV